MQMTLSRIWNKVFLELRPSLSMGLFRIFFAIAIGLHAFPTLFNMQENYLPTAFKEKNFFFFPIAVLDWVEQSPEWLIWGFLVFFAVSWLFFLIGLWSQASCILMTVGLYYFYALNSLHIGTLSFDILLVTLFLMCITNYHGDYFSVDCLRKPNAYAFRKERSYFLQRLLQLQIACIFFYTALYKCTANGNWVTDNPFWCLAMSPETSVVKDYPFRSFFAANPEICYGLGITLLVFEFSMPLWLFIPRLRLIGIGLATAFQAMLVMTLHVPTVFFFHFVPQFLLFLNPQMIMERIDKARVKNRARGRLTLIYDGSCGFCRMSVRVLKTMDIFDALRKVNYHTENTLQALHTRLTPQICHGQLHVVGRNGSLYGGFGAFRRMMLELPMLWPFVPIAYIPGMVVPGNLVYKIIAKNRYLFHGKKACNNNRCFREK
jgi:predicted DCC family thiol-disulfide oxidoreductase YuxK